jgi:putative membrane protein insertion efficiency factor
MLSSEEKHGAKGPVGWLMVGALRVYQLTLSPVFYAFGLRCRHLPTCSAYATDVIKAQGAWRGVWLTAGRLGRCRPGGTHGFDAAPLFRNEAPWWAVWRFRQPVNQDQIDSLTLADRADDKDQD